MNAAVGRMPRHPAMRRIVLGLVLVAGLAVQPAYGGQPLKIVIEFDGKSIAATLDDTSAGRDFASMLPLSLTLNDYSNTEKVAELPRKLAPRDAPPGADPDIGDIAYYPAWGKLRIFYKDLGFMPGLIKLGSIDTSIAPLQVQGPLKVVFKRADAAR